MSSYIMHMCISDIVKRDLKLTDKFVYGSILPDILKSMTGDRRTTHYIRELIIDGQIKRLPDIQRAVNELNIQNKEIKLGYIAHLLEDLIWFNEYIPGYAVELENSKIKYVSDGSIHSGNEFRQAIYSDYTNSNAYIVDKCRVDVGKLITNIKNVVKDEEQIELIMKNSEFLEDSDISKNIFMTEESINSYIKQCTEEVEKMVIKLMGE